MKIDEIIKEINLKKDIKIYSRIPKIDITPMDFNKIFLAIANKNLFNKGEDKEYIIDEYNKIIINQLYYYITKNDKFKGNFTKGILLCGNIGNGKSLIMATFLEIIETILKKHIFSISSLNLIEKISENGYEPYQKLPIYIDDIAKEPMKTNNFGTIENALQYLFLIRYNFNSLTFATSNYSIENGLKKRYTETVTDKFKEMFNIFTLGGTSKR